MSGNSTGLFIFRRDFRLHDNTGLIRALKEHSRVIPAFIFDHRQVGEQNEYRRTNALQFMIESLDDLERQLEERGGQLYYFRGKPSEVVTDLIQSEKIDSVYVNRDYTPFSKNRESAIEEICQNHDINFFNYPDYVLCNPESIYTGSGISIRYSHTSTRKHLQWVRKKKKLIITIIIKQMI